MILIVRTIGRYQYPDFKSCFINSKLSPSPNYQFQEIEMPFPVSGRDSTVKTPGTHCIYTYGYRDGYLHTDTTTTVGVNWDRLLAAAAKAFSRLPHKELQVHRKG